MPDDEQCLRREIALFRFRLVGDLPHFPAGSEALKALLQQRAEAEHRIPGSRRRSVNALLGEALRQAQHAPHVQELAGQLRQPVAVAVQALLEHGQHHHLPQLQAGPPHVGIDPCRRHGVLVGVRAGPLEQLVIAIQVLEASQNGGDVVTAAGVELDVGDGDLAQRHLGVLHASHGMF